VIRRILMILSLAGLVGLVWNFLGHTPWATTLDVASAGEQFNASIQPICMIAGALLIAVPSVLLIRSGWAWFDLRVLGNEPRARVRPDLVRRGVAADVRATSERTAPRSPNRASPGTPDRSQPRSSPASVPTR